MYFPLLSIFNPGVIQFGLPISENAKQQRCHLKKKLQEVIRFDLDQTRPFVLILKLIFEI
ncbi:hypothetical protein T4B_11668 [Trichinella pseudospiralis]|uniref:Uncharacterized protein n=1 Tax=Trichinella pseudospiralis TaxID=6337 RepID=A0A0V1ITL2_TRIPS|nr:hypothetical protein T4A_9770 [Trichinella pseudospiralis]KRZ26162.1 hypothetical protein T4B_11668 [Trichinella pseudospiralis]